LPSARGGGGGGGAPSLAGSWSTSTERTRGGRSRSRTSSKEVVGEIDDEGTDPAGGAVRQIAKTGELVPVARPPRRIPEPGTGLRLELTGRDTDRYTRSEGFRVRPGSSGGLPKARADTDRREKRLLVRVVVGTRRTAMREAVRIRPGAARAGEPGSATGPRPFREPAGPPRRPLRSSPVLCSASPASARGCGRKRLADRTSHGRPRPLRPAIARRDLLACCARALCSYGVGGRAHRTSGGKRCSKVMMLMVLDYLDRRKRGRGGAARWRAPDRAAARCGRSGGSDQKRPGRDTMTHPRHRRQAGALDGLGPTAWRIGAHFSHAARWGPLRIETGPRGHGGTRLMLQPSPRALRRAAPPAGVSALRMLARIVSRSQRWGGAVGRVLGPARLAG